jgi:hypothetical protein
MTRLLCLCLLLLLGACASKKVEERIAHPQLRDLFPPVEASPHPAAAGEAPAAARATTAASGEATAAAGATASSAAGAAAAASAQPQAPVAAQAADKSLTFSPATLDAPTSAQPSAATPAAATAVAAAAPAPAAAAAVAAGPTWPRAITAGGVAFEIYEPQLQSWDGSTLTADAVVTAQPSGEPQPAAGAVRVVARTQVDRAAGQVSLEDIRLTQARFQASPEQSEQWLALLRTAAPRQMTRVSLARLEQGAALMRARESARTPALPGNPRIVLARNPVAVVNIDGEPRLVNVSGTKLQGVINTQALLLKDEAGKFYLRVYDGWMSAPTLRGPWSVAKAPAGAAVAEDMAKASGVVDFLQGKPDPKTGALPSLGKQIPNVVVTTQLSVVVGVNGEAKWAAIPGTKLQYVTNTTANVFRDTAAKRLYVLARGRWFQGTATGTGTWELVPATKLPADLGRIPSGHPKAGIRAYLQESPEEGLEASATRRSSRRCRAKMPDSMSPSMAARTSSRSRARGSTMSATPRRRSSK